MWSRHAASALERNDNRVVVGATVERGLNGCRVLRSPATGVDFGAAVGRNSLGDVAPVGSLQDGHILLPRHGDQAWFDIRICRIP